MSARFSVFFRAAISPRKYNVGIQNLRDFHSGFMATDDFFRSRLDQMIDLKHPLAVLARRMPWADIEASIADCFAHQNRAGKSVKGSDLFGPTVAVVGAGVSNAGRPRLPIRLMVSLLYLKHAYNVSDEELVARWSENVQWQYFSGMEYYTPKLPCDATQIGRFRKILGEAGVEELLKATIDAAVSMKAIRPQEFEKVIVDTTVSEKAVAHPVDSRLLEIARYKLVKLGKELGIKFKQSFAQESKELRRKAAGYAHARQFKRLRRVLRRQRTIIGILLREIERKLAGLNLVSDSPLLLKMTTLIDRARRLMQQKPKDKDKIYALHAPEVECIGKGKARQPYEFGVKSGLVVTHKQGLIVGARTFPGNPFDGHLLYAQLEQTKTLLESHNRKPRQVFADMGFRGKVAEEDNSDVEIIHRGRYRSLTRVQKRHLKRRQAIEPTFGHLKADHGMRRCWLQGAQGDALHVVLCAAGFNLKWLMRALVRMGLYLSPKQVLAWVNKLVAMIADGSVAVNGGQQRLAFAG